MKRTAKIIGITVLLLGIIQLIPVDRTQYPVDKKLDFVEVNSTPFAIRQILEQSCYDCHSYKTQYPSYAYIAPISWSVQDHIIEGREHLNFSIWGSYNKDLKTSMLKNTLKTINNGSMPMPAYVLYHPKAKLTTENKNKLINYFDSLQKKEGL